LVKECIVKEGDVGLSSEDKIPCELCVAIIKLGELVNETTKKINQLEPIIAWKQMKKALARLEKTHHKCGGCGLCFHGEHIAFPASTNKELGDICQWCDREIKRDGLDKFLENRGR